MKVFYNGVLALALLALLQACATTSSTSKTLPGASALAQFHAYHQSWRGTPYRLGGTTRAGIDCSAFVQQAYRSVYGLGLPRTTAQQSQVGKRIKGDYQTGDLVLFKTRGKTRHIGIYLDQQRFLHASTSKGVMISSLDNPYWRKHFWQARRL